MRKPSRRRLLSVAGVLILAVLITISYTLSRASAAGLISVSGTVTNGGVDLSGVTVNAYTHNTTSVMASTTTASDGTYNLSVSPGTFDFRFAPPSSTSLDNSVDANVSITSDTTINEQLNNNQNTFSGTLVDQNSNQLSGVTVKLTDVYGVTYNTSTASDGSFSVNAEPGSYALSISGNLMGTYPNGSYKDGSYTIKQGTSSVDLTGGNVTQSLVLPISAVTVSVYNAGEYITSDPFIYATASGGSTSLYTGDSGESITENINTGSNIPDGTHTLQVLTGTTFSTTAGSSICGYNSSSYAIYGCLASATTITGDVSLAVPNTPPAPNTLSGTLTDQNGTVLSNVKVALSNSYGNASTTTDGSGYFSVAVEPGSYSLSLTGDLMGTYPNGSYKDGSYTIKQATNAINLTGGNIVQNIVLPIANVTASVYNAGYYLASYPYISASANGGSTSLYSGDPGESITVEGIGSGGNSPDGVHTFQVLIGTKFSTSAGSSICGYASGTYAPYGCISNAITITGDISVSVPNTPPPANTFSGTLKDQNGVPLAGVAMSLQNTYGSASTTTDTSGHFTLALEPGSYKLSLSGNLMGTYNNGTYRDGSYTLSQGSNGVNLSNGNVTQNLVLPIANVTVSVYNSGGNAISDPFIRATPSGGTVSLYSGDSGEPITEVVHTGTNIPSGTHTFQVLIGSTFSTTASTSICGYDGGTYALYGCLPTATTITGDVSLAVPNNPLTAPSNLTITSPTNAPVLNWNAVSGATSYKIYRDGSNIGTSTSLTYTDSAAAEGSHTYYVTAISGSNESSASNSVSVTVDKTRPTMTFVAPVSFANPFTVGPTVTVSASDASGLKVMAIHVYTSANQLLTTCGSATATQLAAGSMSCSLAGLPSGTYYIKAGVFDNAGNNTTILSGNFVIQ